MGVGLNGFLFVFDYDVSGVMFILTMQIEYPDKHEQETYPHPRPVMSVPSGDGRNFVFFWELRGKRREAEYSVWLLM